MKTATMPAQRKTTNSQKEPGLVSCPSSGAMRWVLRILPVALIAAPIWANEMSSLGAASDFAVLSLNNSTNVTGGIRLNSATVHGNVGLGRYANGVFQKTDMDGDLYIHSTSASHVSISSKDFDITGSSFNNGTYDTLLANATSDALAASNYYASLGGQILLNMAKAKTTQTITGNNGLNLFSVATLNYNSATLRLNGGPNDLFVFNVTGQFTFANSSIVLNGITPAQVLFNAPTTGRLGIFKSTSHFNGTLLAPLGRAELQEGVMAGAIFAKEVRIHSGAALCHVGFVPEPASILLLALGALTFGTRKHRSRVL